MKSLKSDQLTIFSQGGIWVSSYKGEFDYLLTNGEFDYILTKGEYAYLLTPIYLSVI